MKTPSHRCDPRRTNTAKARLRHRAGHRVRDSEQMTCLKSPNHQGFQSTKSVGRGKIGSFLKKTKHLPTDKCQTTVEYTINEAKTHSSRQSATICIRKKMRDMYSYIYGRSPEEDTNHVAVNLFLYLSLYFFIF